MSDTAAPRTPLSDEEKLQKVDLMCEKAGVSRADAKAALELTDYDALDAVILLERQGKTAPTTAQYSTAATDAASSEMARAQESYEHDTKRRSVEEQADRVCTVLRRLLDKSLSTKLVITQRGNEIASLPVLLVIAVLCFAFWLAVPLAVLSLFFDVRYHFQGIDAVTVDLNDLSDKVSDGAERLKREALEKHERARATTEDAEADTSSKA